MSNDNKLGKFLREVSNMKWDEFVRAEHDPQYTSNQANIFSLIRSCAMQNLQAIKLSVNRLDGKLATPIKVEYPKIYYLYPNAKLENSAMPPEKSASLERVEDESAAEVSQLVSGELLAPIEIPEVEDDNDLPSLSLRQTVNKMSDYPRDLPAQVSRLALEVEQSMRGQGPMPSEIPLVKSVVAAHLLILAQKRNIEALSEVFDQIDGKLVETIKLLGEDIFITSYTLVAPEGAYINKDGVLQLEAEKAQDVWAAKLGKE